jgi:hypothetical protein
VNLRETPVFAPHCQPKTQRSRKLIEIDAIIVAYAMSRLDVDFLKRFSYKSWQEAFKDTGACLGIRPASMKNLRDEFDPIHPNSRMGWHKRPLRPNRQRVLGEFCEASDEAVSELVSRLLRGDKEVEDLVSRPIAASRARVENVAERLRTGRLAEEYFLANSERICGFSPNELVDCRQEARGFDFGVKRESRLAIEVKGLKLTRGQILFTDHEWQQAIRRQEHYWLVVVGSLERQPRGMLIKHPSSSIRVVSSVRQSTVLSWNASVALS